MALSTDPSTPMPPPGPQTAPGPAFDSRDLMRGLGVAVDWRSYPMPHSVCAEEVQDLGDWLQARFQAG